MHVIFLYVRKPLSRQARFREERAKQPVHPSTMAVRVLYANVCVCKNACACFAISRHEQHTYVMHTIN